MPLEHIPSLEHAPGGPGAPAARGTAAPVPAPAPAPVPVRMSDHRPADPPTLLTAHGCWYPSADPTGEHVAFICDRAGVPQLWSGPARGGEAHVLDGDPEPVTEVAWSPDGRWIAYTSAPGGGEHTRVLVVRPDGTGRRVLAGAEPDSSAHLGAWTRDGTALAVTVSQPSPTASEHDGPGHVGADPDQAGARGPGPGAARGAPRGGPEQRVAPPPPPGPPPPPPPPVAP
ncbi:TolB family protein, partial [Streptomyces sp. NPDC058662]|uniref:TolB family protein n=1 Tax=Streptomyces sp. NPDC058662 TaxID=3346583 RepID=UPI003652B75F